MIYHPDCVDMTSELAAFDPFYMWLTGIDVSTPERSRNLYNGLRELSTAEAQKLANSCGDYTKFMRLYVSACLFSI